MKKLCCKVFIFLFGLFGFAGCGEEMQPGEYGMPWAKYILDGSVKNESATPIKGIEIKFLFEDSLISETVTDDDGNWAIEDGFVYNCRDMCSVVATDIDGGDNGGSYKPKTLDIESEQTVEGEGWGLGTYEQHDIDMQLEEDL